MCHPVACRLSKTLSCPSRGFASHLLVARVSSIIISFCCTKNLTVVLLRSVELWQKGCSSALHHRGFSPVHPFHAGIQCRCCRFQVLDGQMLRRFTSVLCSVRSCHIWHGMLHIRQNTCVAGFQPGSCVLVAQNSSRVEANAATVCLSPLFALPTSQRTGARDPDQCGNRGLLKILSTAGAALPQVPHTILAIPTGSIARVLVSSVSPLPKRKVTASANWIRCVLRPHLRVSICSHFRECFVQSGSASIPCQLFFCQCSLTCCGLSRSRQRMMSSPLHHL